MIFGESKNPVPEYYCFVQGATRHLNLTKITQWIEELWQSV